VQGPLIKEIILHPGILAASSRETATFMAYPTALYGLSSLETFHVSTAKSSKIELSPNSQSYKGNKNLRIKRDK
jgi:hypothetical protein